MTIIVWDGKMLAADKQATSSGLRLRVTKIYKIRKHLVGFSGDWDYAQALKHWFENGCKVEEHPKHQDHNDNWVGMLVITPDKQVLKYERSPYPIDYTENGPICIGSGRDYALGALEMGANAATAVAVASKYDNGCGMGIDTLRLGAK